MPFRRTLLAVFSTARDARDARVLHGAGADSPASVRTDSGTLVGSTVAASADSAIAGATIWISVPLAKATFPGRPIDDSRAGSPK